MAFPQLGDCLGERLDQIAAAPHRVARVDVRLIRVAQYIAGEQLGVRKALYSGVHEAGVAQVVQPGKPRFDLAIAVLCLCHANLALSHFFLLARPRPRSQILLLGLFRSSGTSSKAASQQRNAAGRRFLPADLFVHRCMLGHAVRRAVADLVARSAVVEQREVLLAGRALGVGWWLPSCGWVAGVLVYE